MSPRPRALQVRHRQGQAARTAKQAQTSLDTNFPAFASAMTNLTAQGTVDGVLGTRLSGKNLGMIGHFFWLGA